MSARSEKRKAAKKLRKEQRAERQKSYTALDKQHIIYIGVMAVVAAALLFWSTSAFLSEPEVDTTNTTEISTTVPTTTPSTVPSTTNPSEPGTTAPSKPDATSDDNGKEDTTDKKDEGESKEEILKKGC